MMDDYTGRWLRDEFAMAALTGMLASYGPDDPLPKGARAEDVAAHAYEMADAMLKKREPWRCTG